MSRPPRKALLIGVTEYDDPAIDSLPFIADDLLDLGKALESIGYEVEHHPSQHGDRDRIDTAIEQFCRRAEPRQQLLIFLSGHGIHRDGRDYLLPSSADTTSRKFTERCLEIDFGGHIEESRCGDVLVVVDACREGVRLREKTGYGYVQSWSRQQRQRSADRTIAYLYACSSGEMARWKETPDGTFSLFTRAFSRALTDSSVAGTLTAVRDAVLVRLEEFSATLELPQQKPHLAGDAERCARFVLVERSAGAAAPRGASAWAERARAHPAWDLATPDLAGSLRDATVDCATAWSRRYLALHGDLADDPWWDDELAIRMHDRLSWIVKHVLNPGKLAEGDRPPLSPAEAAVLVLMPYAQQLHRAQCAVAARAVLDGRGDEAAEFRRFVDGRRRVQRRLAHLEAAGDDAHASAVRWVTYHRWLAQRPQLYRSEVVADCLLTVLGPPTGEADELLRDVISGDRLAVLLRALRSDPETGAAGAATAELPSGSRTIAGGLPNEQQVRDRLLGLILLVAEEFTIDATALPGIVTDHIGLRRGVEVAEVLRAVQSARWSARGRTRVLDAECPHHAVQVALTEHTQGIAEVLRRIDTAAEADRTLEALRDLPTHVAADGLRPMLRPDGRPLYETVGFRFRLDDDRVQELLMGEQLYGDPALAIRELYQNALDACRYRRARTQHLRSTGRRPAEWSGEIAFTQGVDEDGHAWLECRDNGIGMSERELSSVFSNAGARFADLPEFLEEQAAWDREEIEFYPNSRFGVGVLSYFMLGDEISVSTARFSREGSLLPRLQVDIDGPGSLCRIGKGRDTGESGTTVRVYLRPGLAVSCVDLLTRLLWVSEFAVTASDASGRATWAPDILSPSAPVGVDDPMNDKSPRRFAGLGRRATVDPLPTAVRHVWWCAGLGAILADGLWAGEAPFGRIVDLTGRIAPRLTVDRRRILSMDADAVRDLCRAAIPDLLAAIPLMATLDWVGSLARSDVRLGDLVADAMIDARVTFPTSAGVTIETTLVGVFPPDEAMFAASTTADSYRAGASTEASHGDWRLRAYLRAGLVPGLRLTSDEPAAVLARPSDAVLMSAGVLQNWLNLSVPVPAPYILQTAAELGWAPQRAADRLGELGAQVPEFRWPTDPLDNDDRRLLLREDGFDSGWLDLLEPVPAHWVIGAALALGWSPRRAADRLRELGARLPEFPWMTEPPRSGDRDLLSDATYDPNVWMEEGTLAWLGFSKPVPFGQIIGAAVRLGWSPRQAAERLREWGARTPHLAWPVSPLTGDDLRLLSRGQDGQGPWMDLAEPVSAGGVTKISAVLGRPPRRVAERLRELGAQVPEFPWPDVPLSESDRRLITADPSSPGRWLDLAESIPAGHVLVAGADLGWSPQRVTDRLRELGAEVAEVPRADVPLTDDDRLLLSDDLDGRAPWLDLVEPVSHERVLWSAISLSWSPSQVAERLREWGAAVPDFAWPETPLAEEDELLLTYEDGDYVRWDDSDPAPDRWTGVPVGHVIVAGATLGWSPRQVADRLRLLGLPLPDRVWSDTRLGNDDRRLLSEDGDGRAPWLALSGLVSVDEVMGMAAATGWSPLGVAARLREVGVEVADNAWPDVVLAGDDRTLLSRDLDGQRPWMRLPGAIHPGRVFAAAAALGRTPRQIAQRLAALGAEVPDFPWPGNPMSRDDHRLMARDGHVPGWITFDRPVDGSQLLPGFNGSGLSIGQAARRLRQLGATLPPYLEIVPDEPPEH